MSKGKLAPYLQGVVVKQNGKIRALKITTAETAPNKLKKTGQEYCDAFREKLGEGGKIEHLQVIINSRGGSFYSAAGIQQALHEMNGGKNPEIGRISILIDGMCGSAATFVAFGAYEREAVFITPGSRVFIHMPKVYQYTKTGGIWDAVMKVGTIVTTRTFVELYRRRTGQKRWIIRQWMREGRYFSAEEAVEIGLCDGIMTRAEYEEWRAEK